MKEDHKKKYPEANIIQNQHFDEAVELNDSDGQSVVTDDEKYPIREKILPIRDKTQPHGPPYQGEEDEQNNPLDLVDDKNLDVPNDVKDLFNYIER